MGTIEHTLYELVSPVSEFIVAVHVERGQAVEAGDILLELDPTLATADVARAQASLAAATTSSSVAELEFRAQLENSSEPAWPRRKISKRARLRLDEAAARLREAKALVAAARKRERDHTLRSPATGVVDQLPYDQGERVPAGAVLAVVFDEGPPWVRVWVPETSVALVVPGTRAEIRIDGVPVTLAGSVLGRSTRARVHAPLRTHRARSRPTSSTRPGCGSKTPRARCARESPPKRGSSPLR